MKHLMLDIETRPGLAYHWGMFDQNIGLNQVVEPVEMICWAAKWQGDKRIEFRSVFHDGKEAMLTRMHELLDEADVVTGYNSRSFDVKHINRELALAGLDPYSPFKQIDLLLAVRKVFKFQSNKLEFILKAFGLERKVEHEGFGLWLKCMNGDAKAWAKMRTYNKGDVTALDNLFLRILPWIPSLPNHNLYNDGTPVCPKCGSVDHQKRGTTSTGLSVFQQYWCKGCKGWFRSGKRIEGADFRPIAS